MEIAKPRRPLHSQSERVAAIRQPPTIKVMPGGVAATTHERADGTGGVARPVGAPSPVFGAPPAHAVARSTDALVDRVARLTHALGQMQVRLDQMHSAVIEALSTAQQADANVKTVANNATENIEMLKSHLLGQREAVTQMMRGVGETFTPRRQTAPGGTVTRAAPVTGRATAAQGVAREVTDDVEREIIDVTPSYNEYY